MGKVVSFQRQKPGRAGGIPTILAAMGVAGAAGYFGPGLVEKLQPPTSVHLMASSSTDIIAGRASVIDGDTIEIHGERIRFNGIDALESAQLCTDAGGRTYRCGARSAEALAEWLAAFSPMACKFVERDQYGRFVGDCARADGASVQRWLVRNGHAMDWPRYSTVGVNVSRADFYTGSLVGKLESTFGRAGVPLTHLVLEVSEDVYIGRRDQVVDREIETLRAAGVRVALDDFGTGYASLTHLLNVPIDIIKIDQAFVARLWPEDPSVIIIEGLLEIARRLGIEVVAEGIETEVQASQLWSMGCKIGQGFAFARAADRDVTALLLRRHGERMQGATPLNAGRARELGVSKVPESPKVKAAARQSALQLTDSAFPNSGSGGSSNVWSRAWHDYASHRSQAMPHRGATGPSPGSEIRHGTALI